MAFSVAQRTLERLEWSQILAQLEALARTPLARARLAGEGEAIQTALFESSREGALARLAETAEARRVLASGERPPLGGVVELSGALLRARKGGALAPRELLEIAVALGALRGTAGFLGAREALAPLLAERSAEFSDQSALEREIGRCIDASGEVCDAASGALAAARRDARALAAEVQSRVERLLRDPDTAACLQDAYFTVRNDRYVLPVRAEARSGVRGIVHDASGSGTTLYIEPQSLVEINNRHKQAEIEVEREVARVLRDLSVSAAAVAGALESELEALADIDLAFARADLALQMRATAPEVGDEGLLRLPQLRHPALPAGQAVPNDVLLGDAFHVLVISGPNAGGKTVAMKAAALAVLFVRAGLHVPAGEGSRVDLFDALLADIGDEQSIGESLSTFSAHMSNLASIVERASPRSLVVVDEIGVGTDPGEGAAIAQAVLESLADTGARVIATTHYGLLKEMADVDPRFENASVEFDPETLAPTYRLRMGVPGSSSATAVAARMGLRQDVLERAHRFLAREDRQLDRMLSELAAARTTLESERREAARLREESEAARAEYGRKLERLQARRDELYRTMRTDLDRSFRDAHAEIAGVIRTLQRGGTAQAAAQAREQIQAIETRTRDDEARADLAPPAAESGRPVDWRFAKPGDAVQLPGATRGVLAALPDRRGRVAVRVGGARVMVPAERVGRAPEAEEVPQRSSPQVTLGTPAAPLATAREGEEDAGRCDLRGLRVDEALDRLLAALDRAAAGDRTRILIVHGLGTGALRRAVHEYLAASPYVTRFTPEGDGATVAELVGAKSAEPR